MIRAEHLRCAYLENPVGIDLQHPILSWHLTGEGKKQSACQIVAAHSIEELEQGNWIWNTDKKVTESFTGNHYDPILVSREIVYWKVRIWDENDHAGEWSEPACFEIGLLEKDDWEAAWISGDYVPESGKRYPVDEFKKTFKAGNVVKARLYAASCGIYEAYLNGEKIGDQVFTPGFTSYEKRVHYQTYDVTSMIQTGENKLEFWLGDGWFRGKLGVFGTSNVYGDTTCILAQLELTDAQGDVTIIATDDSFLWGNSGMIRFNDMKDGEDVDRRCVSTYHSRAREVKWETKICCSNNVPVKEHERFSPKVLHTPDGSTVLDFGQNIAGYMAFSVKGSKGHTVAMTFGEQLDEEGNFDLSNLVQTFDFQPDYTDYSRFQTCRYTCGSSVREYYKPHFAVQGFQYVKLENWPEEVVPDHFEAISVYSDMKQLMSFSCSNHKIERLVENTLWSMKGNFLDVPTDCPTRERAAWTGDAQLFFDTGCYFMDFAAFFRKWMRDMFDDQAEDGKIYNIVPRVGPHGGMSDYVEGSSGWTDAGILIPYRYWKHFGDQSVIADLYDDMRKLAEFLVSRMGDTSDPELDQKLTPSKHRAYIVTSGFHFGEWNEPQKDEIDMMLPKYEEATAYLVYSLRCMAEMAEILGKADDAANYRDLVDKCIEAYRFYFTDNGKIVSNRMCKYVRPLALRLLNEEDVEVVKKQLIQMVRENRHHVGTGFLSTPFLLRVIAEAGFPEDAYAMLENEDYPSWIYEINQGATTVWESWNGDCSKNHYSNGASCDWIFSSVCGIQMDGENHFRIAPVPGGTLTYAGCTYQSIYGTVSSHWKKEGDKVIYDVQVPVGCTASLILPDGTAQELPAGKHSSASFG